MFKVVMGLHVSTPLFIFGGLPPPSKCNSALIVATDALHPLATIKIMACIKHMSKTTNIITKSKEIEYDRYTHTSGPLAGKTELVRKAEKIVYGVYTPDPNFLQHYLNMPNGSVLSHLKINMNAPILNTDLITKDFPDGTPIGLYRVDLVSSAVDSQDESSTKEKASK